MSQIVEQSKERPLRSLIGNALYVEGKALGRQYESTHDSNLTEEQLEAHLAAINAGYTSVGFHILDACRYFDDRDIALTSNVSMLKQLNFLPEESARESFIEDLRDSMLETIESLIIDPSGYDFLQKRLEREYLFLYAIDEMLEQVPPGDQYPDLIGYRIGVARYKQIYEQALIAGAIPDKSENSARQLATRLQRDSREAESELISRAYSLAAQGLLWFANRQ